MPCVISFIQKYLTDNVDADDSNLGNYFIAIVTPVFTNSSPQTVLSN